MIRCLIVDDEVIAQQILEEYITATPNLMLIATCRNTLEAFSKLEQNAIDLIFLDIEMPMVNGLTFLRTLTKPPKVIFTTAYGEHALEGFNLGVMDYLLKPFSLHRFQQAIQKVEEVLKTTNTPIIPSESASLVIREKNKGNCKIEIQSIVYIKASKDYMRIVTTDEQFTALITLSKLEELLPEADFIRTHKSYIVAVSKIKFLRNDNLLLSDQSYIPISASYRDKVVAKFQKNQIN